MKSLSRRNLICSTLSAIALAIPGAALAGTATANLGVSATVVANCSITANPVSFGSYDPIGTHASTPLDAAGSLQVACTKGAAATITLGNGANAQASQRRLRDGSTSNYLNYELFSDSGRTTAWNTTGVNPYGGSATAPNRTAVTAQVYGRIAAAQDVPASSGYADTVVATITF